MFLDELSPIAQELMRQPVAFLGGFVSGVFRLNLADDPVRSWLDQQAGSSTTNSYTSNSSNDGFNGRSSGPQSISID